MKTTSEDIVREFANLKKLAAKDDYYGVIEKPDPVEREESAKWWSTGGGE